MNASCCKTKEKQLNHEKKAFYKCMHIVKQ